MKIIKYLFFIALMAAIAVSCEKGLDPINAGDPGTEQFSPELTITYPTEGKIVRSADSIASVVFKFVATDDFELGSVVIVLDGTEIGNVSSFIDYRSWSANFKYNGLGNGDHTLTVTATDKSGKATTQSVNFLKITTPVYIPLDGEVAYFSFDGDYIDAISQKELTVVGTPDFVNEGRVNLAYAGATDSYLELPSEDLVKTSQISAVFWMKVNVVPDRAGILTLSPEDLANPGYPDVQNLRTSGFRFFREGSATSQQFKVNVGLGGTNESWNDGGTIDPTLDEWVHLAFTVSDTESTIYINGEVARVSTMANPIDWTGCDVLTIMSGVPRFTEWSHFSDLSLLDELHIFNRALTAEEVQSFYAIEK